MKPYPAELRAEAQRIAAEEGIGARRICKRFGVPYTTAFRWLHPDYAERQRVAARERKRAMRGTCEDCGAETRYDGHGGRDVARRCVPCGQARSAQIAKHKSGTGKMQIRLYALLNAYGPLRFAAIREALGISNGHTTVLLHRDRVAGRIVRLRRGVYALPEK